MSVMDNSSGSVAPLAGNSNVKGPGRLQVGWVVVTRAKEGRLQVYERRDGTLGGTFICEKDGGSYRAVKCVLARYPDRGIYAGWGHVNAKSGCVFRFISGQAGREPAPVKAIDSAGGIVRLPASSAEDRRLSDGMLVAFYMRAISVGPARLERSFATSVFPLDSEHLPLIARLAGEGTLVLPAHAEAIDLLFSALASGTTFDRHDRQLVDSALSRLGTDANVPEDYRMLARVERTRAGRTPDAPACPSTGPSPKGGCPGTGQFKSLKAADFAAEAVTSDVIKVNLRLD